MSPEESKWWQSRLSELPPETISPIVNLGSSTADYRNVVCPYIHENMFKPLETRSVDVIHADFKAAPGVDIVGDITTPDVQRQILMRRPRAILCNNLLEHVTDRGSICAAIEELLPVGGYAMVSVPYRYPYHPDPIDNGFRPTAAELLSGFKRCQLLKQAEVRFGNYFGQLREKPWLFARDAYLIFGGLVKRDRWRVLLSNYKYLLRRYTVTCVVLQKTG